MVRIVKEHGLVPVPVDINLETTAPTLADLKAATTSKVSVPPRNIYSAKS